ncbi:hypothetical protein ABZ639_09280 [Saccharomonospora sp. NPDC006951]
MYAVWSRPRSGLLRALAVLRGEPVPMRKRINPEVFPAALGL